MDIINIYENYNERESEAKTNFLPLNERVTKAKRLYNSYFSQEFKKNFKICSSVALKHGYKLYLIGGLVRDMLLNKPSLDIDITIEGDAIEFANLLEREMDAKILSVHKDFGTAKIKINGKDIDLASTRSETYPQKGHLPKVAEVGCALEKDVLRRDFTINSLALSLNQENFADLIDYVKGLDDLKAKKIRILHDMSFVDDPTRIIRALKYATRFDFKLDEETFKLQEEYLKNVDYDMCNKRVKQELKKTFEDCKQSTFDKFIEEKIYRLITKKEIKKPKINIEKLIKKHNPKSCWIVYLGVIVLGENVEKLELTKSETNILLSAQKLLNVVFKDDFEIYKAFNEQKIETLLILAALGIDKEVLHYLSNLKQIKLHINGNDLIKLGFKSSKAFSDGFDFVLKKKLKNPKLKKAEELEIIKEFLLKN